MLSPNILGNEWILNGDLSIVLWFQACVTTSLTNISFFVNTEKKGLMGSK